MTTALETRGLGRRYMINWGLRDCTFEIPEGSITGLVGPNGAGKSTLLQLAAGVSRPSAGTVKVFGQEVNQNSRSFLANVGYLDQLRPLYRKLRVEEMLKFGQKLNTTWDQKSASRWLTDLGIPLDWKVSLLSAGQQAQVALAICMGKRPSLLLLDEPMASLDPLARRGVAQMLLDAVAESGTTVVLSSQIVSELELICDHLIILSKAQVQVSGSIESLLANHQVLTGPEGSTSFDTVNVISSKIAGRQATLLVEGDPGPQRNDWEVIAPDLEEIVLAYLAKPTARQVVHTSTANTSSEGDRS